MFGKVLLVGDDTPTMKLVADQVAKRDFEVQLVESPGEALAMAEQSDIDVVVLNFKDLMAEGIRLLRSLKKRRPAIEVITLSVPSGFGLSMESMKLGAFADLLMPFDLEELVGKVLEAWTQRKSKSSSRSLRRKFEDLAVSVIFAEAGDFDTARELIRESPGSGRSSKKEEK